MEDKTLSLTKPALQNSSLTIWNRPRFWQSRGVFVAMRGSRGTQTRGYHRAPREMRSRQTKHDGRMVTCQRLKCAREQPAQAAEKIKPKFMTCRLE